KGPTWLFDLDYLTDSMTYQPVRSENQANKHAGPQESNQNAGTEDNIDAGDSNIEAESAQDYFVLPIWSSYTSTFKSTKAKNAAYLEKTDGNAEFHEIIDFLTRSSIHYALTGVKRKTVKEEECIQTREENYQIFQRCSYSTYKQ
ncbi:hypothetical protein Tco_1308584, partial [Tanacetum coccineum]